MASEYLKKKYKDVKPDVKRELTPAEKRKNWWDYHKWFVVAGIVLLGIFGSIVWNALHQVKSDYQIAYVGEYALPDDTAAAIEAGFAALGEDLNGDGSVVVRLVQYASSGGTDAQAIMAAEVRLMADLTEYESYFFLLEDPEAFQELYDGLLESDWVELGDGLYLARRVFLLDKTCRWHEECTALWQTVQGGALG